MYDEEEEEDEYIPSSFRFFDQTAYSGKELWTKLEYGGMDAVDQPGPSGMQQMLSVTPPDDELDNGLDDVLAEAENSEMDLNISINSTSDGQPKISNIDEVNTLLAINEAFKETLENLIRRITLAIAKNREATKLLKSKLHQTLERGQQWMMRKVPVSRFVYPYFRDSHEMEPPKNREYELKIYRREYDPLVKEEKKWTTKECETLWNAVRKSLVDNRIQPFIRKREMTSKKIRDCGQETTTEQILEWKSSVAELERLITYHKNLPDSEIFVGDYSEVDWVKIAKVDFLGNRTPTQVRLKWVNEQCPRWSKKPWTIFEIQRLRECAERWNNWNVIAEDLGTDRTPFQCFVKFKSDIEVENIGRPWAKEEDAQLMTLAHCMQVNGKMPWGKIAHYMDQRSRQQCAVRYRRALDTDIRFGRWVASEDVLLTCAVSRFGTKDWIKVASCVPGRSDSQCRDRWVNVLDKSNKVEPWSVEEDAKLLEGVKIFGKGEWSRISTIIPGRSPSHCKSRFRSLVSAKVKIASEYHPNPFRRFDWKGKERRLKVEESFKSLLSADGEGDLARQLISSFDMRALSDNELEALTTMEPEQRMAVMRFLKEARENDLLRDSTDEQTLFNLLNENFEFDSSYLDVSTRTALMKYYKKFLNGSSRELLTLEEKNEFESTYRLLLMSDPEAAKCHVINGLCNLVERYDNDQCRQRQKKLTKSIVMDQMSQYLYSVLIFDVNRGVSSGADMFSIPPCMGSVHLYENLQKEVHLLRELAGEYFEAIAPDQDDSLLLQLSQEVTLDTEYVLLKMKMHSLLFWPMLLYRSIESKESSEKRAWLRSVADQKLVLQRNSAVEVPEARLHGSPQQQETMQTEEESDDCIVVNADGLSIGEYLRSKIYKRAKIFTGDKKEEKKAVAVVKTIPDPEKVDEAMCRRIDECIEAVCEAVRNIYERDFGASRIAKLPKTRRTKGTSGASCSRMNREVNAVRDTLDEIINKVANGEGVTQKRKRRLRKKLRDDDDGTPGLKKRKPGEQLQKLGETEEENGKNLLEPMRTSEQGTKELCKETEEVGNSGNL